MVRRLRGLVGARTPVLVFNRELGADWDFLALDNLRGARLATEHLLALGHRRIAFFGGHRDSSSCRQRREGYREALRAAGITPEPQWLVECAPTRLEAARQAGALFVRDPAPTAAVCYNDAVALGLMAGLAARGRRAGEDFAVVGFDDIPEAAGQRAAAHDARRRSRARVAARPPNSSCSACASPMRDAASRTVAHRRSCRSAQAAARAADPAPCNPNTMPGAARMSRRNLSATAAIAVLTHRSSSPGAR